MENVENVEEVQTDEFAGLEDLVGQEVEAQEEESLTEEVEEDLGESEEVLEEESQEQDQEEESSEEEPSDLDKKVSALESRIDGLTAEKNRLKERLEAKDSKLSEISAKIKPERPWEASKDWMDLEESRKKASGEVDAIESLIDLYFEDPERAQARVHKAGLEDQIPDDPMAARRYLKQKLKDQQRELQGIEKQIFVIEDRGQRKHEAKIQNLHTVTEKYFPWLNDPESPEYKVAQELENEAIGDLQGLEAYPFLKGAVTSWLMSVKGANPPQKAAPKPKLTRKQGVIPKPGNAGASATNKKTDSFTAAIRSGDESSIAAALGSTSEY